MKKSHKIMLGSALAFVLIIFSCQLALKRFLSYEYNRFKSPDGKYEIVVYGIPTFIPTMPGNAGDASGFVQLVDQKGNVLNEADISMVQSVDIVDIFWEKRTVFIGSIGEWKLPFLSYEYNRFKSPDSKYELIVYGIPTTPGNADDDPGFVQLVDQKGNVLMESDLDTVQEIEKSNIFWGKKYVNIKSIGTWELP
jgi:hypothetical protein